MSMVSSSNLMFRFLPFSNHHQAQAHVARSFATSTNKNVNNEKKNVNKYHVNEIAAIAVADQLADQLKNLAVAAAIAIAEEVNVIPIPSNNSSSKSSFSNGGLRRTISSLHSGMPSTSASSHSSCCSSLASSIGSRSSETVCTHSNHQNYCIVEAKQVEMEFVNLSGTSFYLVIQAPNNERSAMFSFKNYGKTESFSPHHAGCGHGTWKFEMSTAILINNKKTIKKWTETVYLDGVGSLFFSVDENLQIRLLSQEFLRLPSASQCCHQKRSTNSK